MLHVVLGNYNSHLNGRVVRDHLKGLVALWGGRQFDRDGPTARYVNTTHGVVWDVHSFEFTILLTQFN